MLNSQIQQFFLALTTLRGALFAAPLIVAAGVLLSWSNQSNGEVGSEPKIGVTSAPIVLAKSDAPLAGKVDKAGKAEATSISLFSDEQQVEIGKIIRSYLLKNPEIFQEVGEELARRQTAEREKQRLTTLTSEKDDIFNSPIDFALGDKDADVTIVEYFDYNCGWCKRALNEVTKLSEADKKIRVVMKEFPIFGEHSEFAARAAMASKAQNKYWDYHVALMKAKPVTKDNALKIAESVGIDVEALKKEMEKPKYAAAIERTQRTAVALGIEGTPGFIIDDKIRPGFVPATQLKAMVADIREAGCKFC